VPAPTEHYDWQTWLPPLTSNFPRRVRILAEVLNILEASNGTDHSNLGLFSAPPTRTIGT